MVKLFSFGCHVIDRAYVRMYSSTDCTGRVGETIKRKRGVSQACLGKSPGGGGYSIYPGVGRCGAAPHTLTLFKALFLTMVIVFGLFCYCHSVIKSRATCRPKSRCQSDLSTVSVLVNRSLHQDLMHSGTVERRFQMFVYRPFRFSHSQPRSTKGLFTSLSTGL